MPFEIFERKSVWGGSPTVSFTSNGRFSFNKAATAIFEKNAIENVLLMWDAEKKIIGVKPITKKDNRAYHVSMGKKGNGCGFSSVTFLKYIGYDITKTHSMPTKWDESEGIFLIDVPKEYLTVKTGEAVIKHKAKK